MVRGPFGLPPIAVLGRTGVAALCLRPVWSRAAGLYRSGVRICGDWACACNHAPALFADVGRGAGDSGPEVLAPAHGRPTTDLESARAGRLSPRLRLQ